MISIGGPQLFENQMSGSHITYFCSWDDVEDETTSVDTNNASEVRQFSINLYRYSLAYLDDIRDIEIRQLELLR